METFGTSWGNTAYTRHAGTKTDPTLVFLHGTGCDSDDWRSLQQHLPRSISTLSLDFRGHGGSSVPDEDFNFTDLVGDVNLALEILAVTRPVIVGHSLGGMVGIELSSLRPLEGLVLIEGWTSLSCARAAFEKGPRFGGLTTDQIQEIERKRDTYQSRFHGEQWRAFWHSVTAFDGAEALDRIECPVYEIYGTHKAKPNVQEQLGIPQRPNIQLEWIEGCGHYTHYEQPEQVAEICAREHQAIR